MPVIAEARLAIGALVFRRRTKPDSQYAEPLWRRLLRGWWWGQDHDVYVELTPGFVLLVRDTTDGHILAKSLPGQLDKLDPSADACTVSSVMKRRPTAGQYLSEAATFYRSLTGLASAYARPLFSRRFFLHEGFEHKCVLVELMPSLALRVRDRRSNQILAQSAPGQIDLLQPLDAVDFDARAEVMAKDQLA